jgi:GNAT superfamily N-acetyltransferase
VTVIPAADSWPFPSVRRLEPGDLRQCVALSVDRGWLPEEAKWSLLLTACDTFGVDAPDGQGLAGAVVLTRWGPELASVGMMLVAARYGRRGLGRTLMEHLLAEAGEATVTLFATEPGRPLYEKLGFVPVRRNVPFVGAFRPGTSRTRGTSSTLETPDQSDNSKKRADSRSAAPADLAGILAVDAAAFGADRGRILRRLPGFAERIVVLEDDAGICGYAAAWRNGPQVTVIGPVVAPDANGATRLIADLARTARGQVRLDLDPDRPELPAWAHAHGLQPVTRTTVMARGNLTPRGRPDQLFAPISVALA